VRIAVIVVFVIWICTASWMCSDLGQEWDWLNFVTDDSYLRDYFADRRQFESAYDYPVDVVWELPAYPAVHQLAGLRAKLEGSPWIQDGSIHSWYEAFCVTSAASCAATVAEAQFTADLDGWLSAAGASFGKDVVMDGARSRVFASRIRATYAPESVKTSEQMVEGMRGLRAEVAAAAAGAFPFTFQYMFWEQFAVIKTELYQNIGLALACVLVICALMIAHPGTAVLVCLMVLGTLVSMGGIDWIIGHHIDAIGMVCFAFAVGISVDYSVHIGHNFMMQPRGDRVERVTATLTEMGVPSLAMGRRII
jgi:hypothetical protein